MKWLVIFFLLTALLVVGLFASLRSSHQQIVDETYNFLESVLDSKHHSILNQYRGEISRGQYLLNLLMLNRPNAMGETGESYLVKQVGASDQCIMLTRSIFSEHRSNETGAYPCTDHWRATFTQGSATRGIWRDYRGVEVYGVGHRMVRAYSRGSEPQEFSIIVEKDVSEVRGNLAEQQRNLLLVFLMLDLSFIAICIGGYMTDRKKNRVMRLNLEAMARIERKSEQLETIGKISRHDVANHLTVAQTCLQYEALEGYDKESSELALSEINAAIALGKSLSQLTRFIQNDDGNLATEAVSMNELVDSVAVQGLALDVGELGSIDCNSGLMQSVIRNLMENSQKYAPDNPRMAIWRDGSELHFKDWSGGFGVVEGVYNHEYAQRLTMPNQRGQIDTPGSGLGLSNIKAHLGAHGFSFTWVTTADSGTTEWIIDTSRA